MKLWEKVKALWRKWTHGDDSVEATEWKAPATAEDQVVKKMADELGDVIESHGKPFVRQVVIIANEVGVPPKYLQYLFWTLVEGQRGWPEMQPAAKKALAFGRDVMVQAMATPAYRSGLTVPPFEIEGQVDMAVKKTAFWVMTAMHASILKKYLAGLKKWDPAMRKAVAGRLAPNKAMPYLKSLFEAQLDRNASKFNNGDLLDQWVFNLFL